MSVLNLQPTGKDSFLPTYSPQGNYTIYANEDAHIKANIPISIKSGFRLSFPSNYCAFMTDYKPYNQFKILGGLIDSDFRGEIGTTLISPVDMFVKRGSPLSKIIVIEIGLPVIENAEDYLNSESSDSL